MKVKDFCWFMGDVMITIEQLDKLRNTNIWNGKVKVKGRDFLNQLLVLNQKFHKVMGGADEVENGYNSITRIVEQQMEIRHAIDINNVEQLIIIQQYQNELLQALRRQTDEGTYNKADLQAADN